MAEGNGRVSLAFGSGAKKPQRRVEVQHRDEGVARQEVTGFGAGGLQTREGAAPGGGTLKVIAKLENTYRAGPQKFQPSYLPEAADRVDAKGIDKFETAAHDTATAQGTDVVYGLITRKRPADGAAPDSSQQEQQQQREQQEQQQDASGSGEQQLQQQPERQRHRPAATPADDARQLAADLEHLPEMASLEAYEAMPVEAFGEALLRGMGWTEGRSLGRNAKQEEVVAKELVRRPQRLGLGAAPAPEQNKKKYIKPGESRDQKDLIYVDRDGQEKAARPVGAALTERKAEGPAPGRVMRVIEGRHSGMRCEVQALEAKREGRSDRARVRLLPSYEVVTVRCSELGEDRGQEGSAAAAGPSGRSSSRGERDRDGDPGSRGRDDGGGGKKRSGSSGAAAAPAVEEGVPWLVPNIRVKIIDKRCHGGRLYLKKATIVDVKAPTLCDVQVGETRESVLDLRQSQLETSVPGVEGTSVVVVLGPLRGKRGRLLQRSAESGLAAVQLTSDFSVHKLSLDDISEYTGPTDTWDDG